MLYFLLRILFFYLFFRFVFRAVYFLIRLVRSRANYNSRDRNYQKTRKQPAKNENIVDAEFREVK